MKYLFSISALLFTTMVMSQPGSLDRSFADTGVFVSRNLTGICHDIVIQKDGKIVSIGSYSVVSLYDGFLINRYNTDGTPDLSFGDSGRVVTIVSSLGSAAYYGTIQEDGKILAVGRVVFKTGGIGYNDLVIVRYNTDGNVDSSFGVNGIARENIQGVNETAAGIAVQPDGKIVMGGFTDDPVTGQEPPTLFLLRYNPDGSPDLSFGNKGLYQEEANLLNEAAIGFALQPDGKILLGATNYYNPPFFFFVRRYTSSGEPDRTFGTNGEARLFFPPGTFGGDMYAIALREDARIVCGGSNALAQFNGDGSVDKTFGKEGFVYVDSTNTATNLRDIALQGDGKVLAAGYRISNPPNSSAFLLLRYEGDGTPDSSFGDNGVVLTAVDTFSYANALALQKDGRIVSGGNIAHTYPYIPYVTLARYNGDESRRQIVADRIKRWLQHHGITWQGDNGVRYYTVQRSVDGGVTYQPVARINNSHLSSYTYEDVAANSTHDSYRVVTVSKDGGRAFSNVVMMDDASGVKVFPNPVRSSLQIQGLPSAGKTNISISDFSGNVRTSAVTSGSQYSVNTANLKPGNYLLKVQHDNTVTTQTFVKE